MPRKSPKIELGPRTLPSARAEISRKKTALGKQPAAELHRPALRRLGEKVGVGTEVPATLFLFLSFRLSLQVHDQYAPGSQGGLTGPTTVRCTISAHADGER